MQVLMIAGIVGKDAVLRQTSGDDVLGFSVAVDNGKDKNGEKRDATWFDCSLWGKRAASLETYIKKGTRVAVTGRPTAREYEGKVYLGISVDNLTLLGGGQQSEGGSRRDDDRPTGREQQRQQPRESYDLNDDIPF